MAAPAHAVDGTITITGEITDQTCKINGKLPPADILVQLPRISTSALKAVGDTAGATVFTIKLTECPAALSGNVKAHFEPGPTVDFDSGNLYAYTDASSVSTAATSIPSREGATKANNVGIQLANPDGSKITIGPPPSGAGVALTATSGDGGTKEATLLYMARYVKTGSGDISTGKLVTYVQYSIVYP